MAGGAGGYGRDRGLVLLREAGEGVEFPHDDDDRLAAAVGRGERCRHLSYARLDLEAVCFQFLLQEGGAFRFVETELGGFPDFARDNAEAVGVGGYAG